jgi:hypothetical protein
LYDISAGVRSTRSEDGGIVLDIDHGRMFRLNPVGVLILESLGKGCAESEIARQIARQYSISEEAASADLGEFLQSLAQYQLVHVREEGIA